MTSGVEPTVDLSGAPYIQMSMQSSLGTFGPIFITVSMMLFAFTTLLGNLFYVDKAIAYINKGMPGKNVMRIYYVIASLLIYVGAGLSADLLWNIADVTMGGMTLINIPVIMILGKYTFRALDDYKRKCAKGEDLVFRVNDIGLPHKVDYWE
jgi:AGCS family alanine or glycine:cation symporter